MSSRPAYYFPIIASERIQRRIDILLDEADEAFAQRNWETVKQRAHDALALAPENQDAITFLAAADRALGANFVEAASEPLADSPPTASLSTGSGNPEAERRQLTVMFCDLQSSTALSHQLDPEELRDVIRSYQELCVKAISRFEGHIAKYLGDGLLVYFGYPQAHEDDPQRAVRAGLAILEDMGRLNIKLQGDKPLELAVRIGVHTGLVIAGEMGGGDTVETMAIVGETPNVAARLQEAAEPNSLVISNITANLIEGFFLCEDLGARELRGISEPMELFAVLSESGALTRFDVAAATRLTPLVGREQELGLLLDRWEQATEGLGQVLLLSGEPGIGKSRLISAMTDRLGGRAKTIRHLRCSAYHQNSAFHPVIEYIEGWLGLREHDSIDNKLARLASALTNVDFPAAESVPLLAGLLAVHLEDDHSIHSQDPETQQARTLELLVALMLGSAKDQPLILVVEDLHWADASTVAMLGLILDQAPTVPMLALFSFRPGFAPPWEARSYVTSVLLNRLTRRVARDMIESVTRSKTLPDQLLSEVISKCDGVPLFVEELTRMVIESGLVYEIDGRYELAGPLPSLAIPSSIQDALTARLDSLGAAREVVQLSAVLGREFNYELLQTVSSLEEEALKNHLQRLVAGEFLYQRGQPPEATYIFKHALIQDAAYAWLLRSRRQQHHQQIAQVMEKRFPATVDIQPELLAHHYAESGLVEQAMHYWRRAGDRALATYAHEEALSHFQRALKAKGFEPSTIGADHPLDEETAAILLGLGYAQIPLSLLDDGVSSLRRVFDYYAAAGNIPGVVEIAQFEHSVSLIRRMQDEKRRALELVDPESHDAGRILPSYGYALTLEPGGYGAGIEAFSRALAISRRENDKLLEMRTLSMLGNAQGFHLRWEECLEACLQAIELGASVDEPISRMRATQWATEALIELGQSEQASRRARDALDLAQRLHSQVWLRFALRTTLGLAIATGDWPSAPEAFEGFPSEAIIFFKLLFQLQLGEIGASGDDIDYLCRTQSEVSGSPYLSKLGLAILGLAARITDSPELLDPAESTAGQLWPSENYPWAQHYNMVRLSIVAVERRDSESAAHLYAEISSRAGYGPWLINHSRLLGLLAHAMGELNQAALHFDDALAFCRKAGYRPDLAWTCCDYADTIRDRDADGDRFKAITLLDESLAISSELGMRPLMERALSRREILKP